ncbi:hypothetical protein BKA69DRAFT_1107890 [Paraphysoderma sedebokerense]|nr:hypothetical protein BKA69DRAFT_1107890 [Paraphysoderma sedebokerense]
MILLSRFKSAMNHPCLRTFDFDTLAEHDLPRLKQHHNLFSSGNGRVSSHSQLPSQPTETLPANISSVAPTLSTAVPMSSAPSTISVAPPLNNANSPTVPTSTLPMTADEVTAVQATAAEVDSALPRTHDIGMSPIPPVPNQIHESIDHPSSTSSDKLLSSEPS